MSYIGEPKKVSSAELFLEERSSHDQDLIKNMMKAIIKNKLTDYIKNFDKNCGFTFCGEKEIYLLMNDENVKNDGHSGCSAGITLRNCQYMLKNYDGHEILIAISKEEEDTCCCIDILPSNPCRDSYPVISQPNPPSPPKSYIAYNGMDDNNKKAMNVWQTEGVDAAIKHMMTGSDGKPRSYAEMRELYG